MGDGHSSNMSLINNKLLKSPGNNCLSIEGLPGAKNFPFFDNTHLFKNVYNNFMKCVHFKCPLMDPHETKKELSPSFSVLRELYELEKSKSSKMAHKLNEKVLNPKPIEKTNVKLADAAFHESTINALKYYSSRGYEHFEDTAIFLQ